MRCIEIIISGGPIPQGLSRASERQVTYSLPPEHGFDETTMRQTLLQAKASDRPGNVGKMAKWHVWS
jgi:hypothetical protein